MGTRGWGENWVVIFLVARGRKLNCSWFEHKGNLVTHVNKSLG